MDQYKYQLQIRDKRYKDQQQIYATKLGQYDLQMKAADRAAARAYGIEQYNQSQRLKQAAFQGLRLDRALAKSGGMAAARGMSGRSAQRIDTNIENQFVRNQNMIAQNLLTAEETRDYRELGIQDRSESQRNRAYGQVAIAPTVPLIRWNPLNYLDLAQQGGTLVSLMLALVWRLVLLVPMLPVLAVALLQQCLGTSPGMGIPGSVAPNGAEMYGPAF